MNYKLTKLRYSFLAINNSFFFIIFVWPKNPKVIYLQQITYIARYTFFFYRRLFVTRVRYGRGHIHNLFLFFFLSLNQYLNNERNIYSTLYFFLSPYFHLIFTHFVIHFFFYLIWNVKCVHQVLFTYSLSLFYFILLR